MATTISETIRGHFGVGHEQMGARLYGSLVLGQDDFAVSTILTAGAGGYDHEVPRCQGLTRKGEQCSRAGIIKARGQWYAVLNERGEAVCGTHAGHRVV